jgi:hypothetical protein
MVTLSKRFQGDSPVINRRELLHRTGLGIGSLGLAEILRSQGSASGSQLRAAEAAASADTMIMREPQFRASAKRVIHLRSTLGDRWATICERSERPGRRFRHHSSFDLTANPASKSVRSSRVRLSISTTWRSFGRCMLRCRIMSHP